MRHKSENDFFKKSIYLRRPQNLKPKRGEKWSGLEITFINNQCKIFVRDTKIL